MNVLYIVVLCYFGLIKFAFEARCAVWPQGDLDGRILGHAGQPGHQCEEEKYKPMHWSDLIFLNIRLFYNYVSKGPPNNLYYQSSQEAVRHSSKPNARPGCTNSEA